MLYKCLHLKSIYTTNGATLLPFLWKLTEGKPCVCSFGLPTIAWAPEADHSVFVRSNTRVLVSNSTRGMGVCVLLFCVCVVLYVGSGLEMGWSLFQGGSHISRQWIHRWQWGCKPYAPAAVYPPGKLLVLISVRDSVDPRAIQRLEGLCQLKKKKEISSGLEPATFRLVA
jgi:hypothetical protein